MFCNPETIDNRRLFSGSVHPRRFDELIFVDVTDLRHIFRRVFFYDFLQFLKTFGTLGDKFFVDQTFLYHHVHHAVGEHDIRSRLQFQMNIRVLRQTDISRIDDDKPRSVLYRLTDLHSHHRMSFLRIGSHQQNAVYVVGDIFNRICHSAGAQRHRQTGNRCGMGDAGALSTLLLPKQVRTIF